VHLWHPHWCGAYVMSTWCLHGSWEHTWEQTFPWTCKCMFPWLGTSSVPTWECIIPTYECVSPCGNFQIAWKHLMSQLWNNTFPCLWTFNVPIWGCQDKGMHRGIHYNHCIGFYHAHVHSMCSHCIFACEHVMEKIGEVLCSLTECVVHIESLMGPQWGRCFWFLMCWRLLCE
jgi:hypothetical protein